MWRMYSLMLSFLLLGSALVQADYIGQTREGLSFHVSAVPSEIYLPNDLISNEAGPDLFPAESTLTVHVRDVDQKPVMGVPVTFKLTPSCKSVATLKPGRAVTSESGIAHATVEAGDTTGVCRIAVQVDNVSQMTRVTVNPVPEYPSADEGGTGEIR
jgi:hypothetical protein